MTQINFSIVTVTLNTWADALRTAQSVQSQDYRSFEYLVKDGGSTDGTVEQLQELGIRVIVQPDAGIYDAMNQALSYCRGEYVCFLNAGDVFYADDVLFKVARWLSDHNSPEFAFGDIISFSPNPHIDEQSREIHYPNRLSRFYLYRKMICHQAWFVRRDLLEEKRFAKGFRIAADYDFLLKTIIRYKIRYLHIPFITVVYKGGGVSENNNQLLAQEIASVQKTYFFGWECALYKLLFNTVWRASKRFIYSIYHFLPATVKRRAAGW